MRRPHHGPIVNEALGADDAEPLTLGWLTLDEPAVFAGMHELLEVGGGASLVGQLAGRVPAPASNLDLRRARLDRLRADRPAAAARGRHPRPAQAELDGRARVAGVGALCRDAGGGRTPRAASWSPPTTGIISNEWPHHASEGLARFRARADRRAAARRPRSTTSRARGDADRRGLEPGLEAARRLGRLKPATQRERSAIERLRSWDGRLGPETIVGTICQAYLCAWLTRSRGRRWATGTWSSVARAAPTTAWSTSPRPGAGTRT